MACSHTAYFPIGENFYLSIVALSLRQIYRIACVPKYSHSFVVVERKIKQYFDERHRLDLVDTVSSYISTHFPRFLVFSALVALIGQTDIRPVCVIRN